MNNGTEDIFLLVHNTNQIPEDSEVVFKYVDIDYAKLSEPSTEIKDNPVFYSFATPFDSIDYPISYYGTEIISSRALGVINSNYTDSQVKLKNITVIDTNLEVDDPRSDLERDDDIIIESVKHKKYSSNDYYLMEIPIIENLLDMEKSDYKKYPDGTMGIIKRYVLREYSDSLSPIFTIKEDLGAIFVAGKLRKMWREAGINGTAYLLPDEPFGIPDIDVPIE